MPPKRAATSVASTQRETRPTAGGRRARAATSRAAPPPSHGANWPYGPPPELPTVTPNTATEQPDFVNFGTNAPLELRGVITQWRTRIDEAFAIYNDFFVDLNGIRIPTTNIDGYAAWKTAHHLLKTEIEDAEYLLQSFFTLDTRVQFGSTEELVSRRFNELTKRSLEFFDKYSGVIGWMPGLIDHLKMTAPDGSTLYHPRLP
ncbi:uncharacterized protein LOC62_02G003490 [Vanrija pseudolonga]|uniref:Uncharacterized protein n=1 Tax=Vanrija pseudolonga TaxID=143232 RepID=A0AAF0Y8K8_9TREE|nr:hypothetical protein LOC62_02G003490 [Vanrija pseudolonga]